MRWTDIAAIRLRNQRVAGSVTETPGEVVSWMGAMQAQDFNMCKWAVGLRLRKGTLKIVEEAINNGNILRTHVMRPTWHLVQAADVHWLLELTSPHIRALMRPRNKQLELTDKVFTKAHKLLEKALVDGNHCTRDELLEKFRRSGIAVNENRAAHIFMEAELTGLICSGRSKNKKQTYALLEERAPVKKTISREEALAALAGRYFCSHGPATVRDFSWWSGLSVTVAKKAVEMVKKDLVLASLRSEVYWFDPSSEGLPVVRPSVFLLPAYDEFIIAYKDRTASLITDHHAKVISANGIFWPAIIVNGKVTGTWSRTGDGHKLTLGTEFFKPHPQQHGARLKNAGERSADFLEQKIS